MDSKDWLLHPIAKRQHGVFSDEQAGVQGFCRDALRWRLKRGVWCRVLTGVSRLYWADDDFLSRCWAASLWSARNDVASEDVPQAALSHKTAARLLGLDVELSDDVEFTNRRGPAGKPRSWLQVYCSKVALKTVTVGGLVVTTAARTLVDLAATLDEREHARVTRLALRQGRVTVEALSDELRAFGGFEKKRMTLLVRV